MDVWSIVYIVGVVAVIMLVASPGIAKTTYARLNREQGVLAHWEKLRITRTELIEGYKKDAPRYPIAGMAAHLDGCGGRISVIIERPSVPTRIVASRPVGRNFTFGFRPQYISSNAADDAAKFVQGFNIASNQAALWTQP